MRSDKWQKNDKCIKVKCEKKSDKLQKVMDKCQKSKSDKTTFDEKWQVIKG